MKHSLGDKVRTVRESRSMTPEQLAERADLDPGIVARIESGDLIPSLSPLIRIARSLGVRLGTLLDEKEQIGPVICRAGGHEPVMGFSDHEKPARSDLDFYSLAANKAGRHMEPFIVEVHPGSSKGFKPSSHEGEEFIFVLSGEIEILYGRDTWRLKTGDSIYYDSIVPHHVHCAGEAEARIVGVVYAP